MFAVIHTGGKQYIVKKGDTIAVEKIEGSEGKKLEFKEVLLISSDDEKNITVGTPYVPGAVVAATIMEQGKAKKVSVIKYKPKIRYRRNVGHRQPFTKITIDEIKN